MVYSIDDVRDVSFHNYFSLISDLFTSTPLKIICEISSVEQDSRGFMIRLRFSGKKYVCIIYNFFIEHDLPPCDVNNERVDILVRISFIEAWQRDLTIKFFFGRMSFRK